MNEIEKPNSVYELKLKLTLQLLKVGCLKHYPAVILTFPSFETALGIRKPIANLNIHHVVLARVDKNCFTKLLREPISQSQRNCEIGATK